MSKPTLLLSISASFFLLTCMIADSGIVKTAKADTGTGLVGFWKFDEATGQIAVDFSGTNNGTVSGATWTAGKTNNALNFDGMNDYIALTNSSGLALPDKM